MILVTYFDWFGTPADLKKTKRLGIKPVKKPRVSNPLNSTRFIRHDTTMHG